MDAMSRRRFLRIGAATLTGLWLSNPTGAEAKYSYNAPLYHTVKRSGSRLELATFTSRDEMIKAAHAQSSGICQSPPYNLPEVVLFFEHMNEDGYSLPLDPGYGFKDLTKVRRTLRRVLFPGNWNDKISSVSWCRWNVSLFEHINYEGEELFLPAGCSTTYLEELGWNDRASSVVNWGP